MLPSTLNIDFSGLRKNLVNKGLARVLAQYKNSPLLNALITVWLEEVQELYNAIIDLQEYRTLYKAEGDVLDGLGRIVGTKRTNFNYNDEFYFAPDKSGVQPDNGYIWCQNAPTAGFGIQNDLLFRETIWRTALSNFTKFGSIPEIQDLVASYMNEAIGFEVTGPFNGILTVAADISLTNLEILTYTQDTEKVEHQYRLPYPTTTNFEDVVFFVPQNTFIPDKEGQGADLGRASVKGMI